MSDEAEAIESAAKGAASGLVAPIADVMKLVLGPGAEEAGLILKDYFHMHRRIRWVRYQKRVRDAVNEAGFTPQPVQPKLLHAMIDAATLEEDDTLQDIWANMMANASRPEGTDAVVAVFPEMLKGLSPRNVRFLDALYEFVVKGNNRNPFDGRPHDSIEFSEFNFTDVFHKSGLNRSAKGPRYSVIDHQSPDVREDVNEIVFTVDLLKRQGIVAERVKASFSSGTAPQQVKVFYTLSRLGVSFVEACRPPRQKRA